MLIDMNDTCSAKDTSIIMLNSYQVGILFDALQDYYDSDSLSRSDKYALDVMIEALKKVVL